MGFLFSYTKFLVLSLYGPGYVLVTIALQQRRYIKGLVYYKNFEQVDFSTLIGLSRFLADFDGSTPSF